MPRLSVRLKLMFLVPMVCGLLCSGCFTYLAASKQPLPSTLGIIAAFEAGAGTSVGIIAHSQSDEEDRSLAIAILGGVAVMGVLDIATVLFASYLKDGGVKTSACTVSGRCSSERSAGHRH